MKTHIVAYLSTLIVFVAIDFIWLSSMADRLYRPMLGDLLAPSFQLAPAIAFYLIYAAGLTFLAVRPGLTFGSLGTAVLYGAIFGFAAYATYDLTNQATLRKLVDDPDHRRSSLGYVSVGRRCRERSVAHRAPGRVRRKLRAL